MSEITHVISGTVGPIHKCCDLESTRYALGHVHMMPRGTGGVWLTATDTRILSMVQADGTANGAAYVPVLSLAKRGGTKAKPAPIERNGEWRTGNTVVPVPKDYGRFPPCGEVLPDLAAHEAGHIVVVIDAAKLKVLADSLIGHESQGVSLIIPIPAPGKTVEGAIPVVGRNGFGVVMPLSADSTLSPATDKMTEYGAMRKAYRADWKPGFESPAN